MNKDFWLERWENRKIGFHQGHINPYLKKHWPGIDSKAGNNVFVPLCGKSEDLIWLASKGYEVTGVEFSQIAVEEFFQKQSLAYDVTISGNLKLYQSENIRIYQGDFFDLTIEALGNVSIVFDRAAMIALPDTMREAYCSHLRQLAAGASILLISMEYDQALMQGPPFSVPESEIGQHYSKFYQIDILEETDLLSESSQFSEQGLKSLKEKAYKISPLT